MSKNLYLHIGDGPKGPFDFNEIWKMLASGEITAETSWAMEGQSEWRPVGQLLEKSYPQPNPMEEDERYKVRVEKYRRDQASLEAERVKIVAERFVIAGFIFLVCCGLSGLTALVGIVEGEPSHSAPGWFIFFGCVSFALYLLGQVMHIRSAVDRKGR